MLCNIPETVQLRGIDVVDIELERSSVTLHDTLESATGFLFSNMSMQHVLT